MEKHHKAAQLDWSELFWGHWEDGLNVRQSCGYIIMADKCMNGGMDNIDWPKALYARNENMKLICLQLCSWKILYSKKITRNKGKNIQHWLTFQKLLKWAEVLHKSRLAPVELFSGQLQNGGGELCIISVSMYTSWNALEGVATTGPARSALSQTSRVVFFKLF